MSQILRLSAAFKQWLERVDPYYTQRIILRKSVYLATLVTAINFIARPEVFAAYAFPIMLLASFYELPSFTTYRQKYRALVLSFMLAAIGCVLFYLMYPYKFYLLITAMAYYYAIYAYAHLWFPQFKPCILQTILVAALNMTVLPSASLQIGIDMFFCVTLGLLVTFFALKLHPNLYAHVWQRALQLYTLSVEHEIGHAINKLDTANFMHGITHLNTIRNYKHLLPRTRLINRMKMTLNIRNISFILTHLYYQDKNEAFWFEFQAQVRELRLALVASRPCQEPRWVDTLDKNEAYAQANLAQAIQQWNKICLMR